MASFIIEGRHPLRGAIRPIGNKNAALPMLAACLLTDEPITLHNVPNIGDVKTMLRILGEMGVSIQQSGSTVTLCARDVRTASPDPMLFSQIRGSLTLMGPLLARFGRFEVKTSAGGDDIGRRRIDTHLHVLGALGARLAQNGKFELQADGRLRGKDILLDEASVTATENGVMAAALAQGTTILRNAASEPHVQDLCHLLMRMGCHIEGIGSNVLTIHGCDRLHGAEAHISPDFVEVGSYIGMGAITPGELRIVGVVPEHLRMMEMVFVDRLGVRMHLEEDPSAPANERYTLVIEEDQELRVRPDFGGAVPKIDDAPWPAFPPDLMSIALVTATQAQGTVIIHEKMYESRLFFVDKLIAMGAQIILCDPHRAVVVGPSRLTGQQVTSPDIRAGMALVLAALAAEGVTTIGNVQQIDRGYQEIDVKLRALGAHIERVE
ncbi:MULTISPECIES: UDP-N-acetylglucosamine 1-carboxyvinyltransferase [Caldilinea]|jgi:UDP-N-acetylglucosamine 1-carboxyvinyltransferase|uniref:UDP-N-acetylglucosamine 1-carboxyvinyltransferase n=2 Tax=Caldilineaceae TaxID=475964 RepID=I0HYX3_CALAS|nr:MULTISPECIES: UDP-N-acetylglucosamine 1-carboxyvinyltransferase [Caldilinea]MBO9393964.1 UDP-N-acetylglucosamine 1-carboxyvinyltransferase [Caldilinea sp.]BAL98210.1 UDP-N-acetylglucosamine 1-carboxyvinyltransferase [Caldilinea aerophila DSM 14535 = NBRC 104270]GIV75526.1 MAG: UDP-N-acetylglucosamine 1-carboxyvinyltransferase [Caldilinea sp.]